MLVNELTNVNLCCKILKQCYKKYCGTFQHDALEHVETKIVDFKHFMP